MKKLLLALIIMLSYSVDAQTQFYFETSAIPDTPLDINMMAVKHMEEEQYNQVFNSSITNGKIAMYLEEFQAYDFIINGMFYFTMKLKGESLSGVQIICNCIYDTKDGLLKITF